MPGRPPTSLSSGGRSVEELNRELAEQQEKAKGARTELVNVQNEREERGRGDIEWFFKTSWEGQEGRREARSEERGRGEARSDKCRGGRPCP